MDRRSWMLATLWGWSIMAAAVVSVRPAEGRSTFAARGNARPAVLRTKPAPPRAEATAPDPGTSATLIWTAPGDDGMEGVASVYDLRYSTLPITEANFYLASRVTGLAAPLDPGVPQVAVVRDLLPYVDYYFAIKTGDESGNWSPISNIAIRSGSSTVSAGGGAPVLAFSAPVPNPARYSARFALTLPLGAPIRVEAFDLSGRRVRSLVDGYREAGATDVTWDLRDDLGTPVRAGIYLVRAVLPGKVVTHRTAVVR